jgi:hypothetical protein
MLRKNSIKVIDRIFPHKFTPKFLGDNSLIPCIQGVSGIRVLISIRSRACEMKRFFYLNILRKSVPNCFKFGKNLP